MQENKKKIIKIDCDFPIVEDIIDLQGEGAVQNFKLELLKAFRKPFARQVFEFVKLTLSNP